MFGGDKYVKISKKELKELKKTLSPKEYKELEKRIKQADDDRFDDMLMMAMIFDD